jgi:hypothetical protein
MPCGGPSTSTRGILSAQGTICKRPSLPFRFVSVPLDSHRRPLYDAAVTAQPLPPSGYEATVVNLAGDRLTADIVAALRADGLPSIVLKGASIREWLYEAHEERASGDVDLLVPTDGRERVDAALAELGLRGVGPSRSGRGRLPEWLWEQPETKMIVDLHESISGAAVHPAAAWSVLSESTARMSVGGETVDVLDLPRRAVHLALHAAQHGPAFDRPVEDLERGLAALPEATWREAAVVAERLDAVPAFVAGLQLARGGPDLVSRLGVDEVAAAPTDVARRAAAESGARGGTVALSWLALRMAMWSLVLPLLKRVVPLRALARAAWTGGIAERSGVREQEIVRLSGALPRVRPRRGEVNCLLLAYRFLAQANAEPKLVVGIRQTDHSTVGHAWVTIDGQPVHDSAAVVEQFVPLVEFGPHGRPVAGRGVAGELPDRWE